MLNPNWWALPLGFPCSGRNRLGVTRFLLTFVTLGTLLAFYHTSLLSIGLPSRRTWTPHSSKNSTSSPVHDQSRFIAWLRDRVPNDHVPFVTIGDCQYMHSLRNFRHRLDQWGYGNELVVICLDQCCADTSDYHAYTRYIGESVAYIKFSVSLDLTVNGYSFVFFDGDVYLTGTDPFKTMLPLSDDTWDIQFQTDHPDLKDWNIGWYFAKSTEQTYQLFNRSYAQWNATQAWDQSVMWDVGHPMENATNPLRVHLLNQTDYKNFMLYGLESPFRPNITQKLVEESTAIHFTCVEQSLKSYFGYYFGGFGDMDHYYSEPPLLVGMTNVSGMIDAIHAQVAFAATLTRRVHRTFIWPNTVNIVQKRFNATRYSTTLEHHERQAGIRAVSWESAQKAKLATVEGNYLTNLKRVTNKQLEIVYLDARTPIAQLERRISSLPENQVAMLDFSHFAPPIQLPTLNSGHANEREQEQEQEQNQIKIVNHPTKSKLATIEQTSTYLEKKQHEWFEESFNKGGYRNYSSVLLTKLKKCARAELPAACLGACD